MYDLIDALSKAWRPATRGSPRVRMRLHAAHDRPRVAPTIGMDA